MTTLPKRLLIAASGTGGHLFPAIALAEQLPDYAIEWLGVPDRLETQLVPDHYPLHTIAVEGFQQRFGLGTIRIFLRLLTAILKVRRILNHGKFHGVFTTGGYIAAPAVLAARSLGLPVIFHESNALPGKVTRLLSRWCSVVAVGFNAAIPYLPHAKTICVGTPVRAQFLDPSVELTDLPIPAGVPLIVVVGGSQGAVAVNQVVRQCAPVWLEAGIWIVHLTGDNDPDVKALHHDHYICLPFYSNMAALFQRADLAISRAGAGTLTELAVTHTPSILIPYPYAAEDHQAYNAAVFTQAGAAYSIRQADLTPDVLQLQVMELFNRTSNPTNATSLQTMAQRANDLAVADSATQLAALVRETISS